MGALSELLAAANPASPANRQARVYPDSRDSRDSQQGTSEIRAHLLALAADEGLPAALVQDLCADDVTACAGLSDATLRAYLRVRERGAVMDASTVPEGYTKPCHCAGCGLVLLWPGCPPLVKACPWCFRRRAGKPVPRPA